MTQEQLREMQLLTTLDGLAEALNARAIPTARGGAWHGMTVRNVLARGAV